jgi:hypothetical protein
MAGDATRGGLIVRAGGMLQFLPDTVAVRVVPLPPVTPVPGAPPGLLGIGLHDGAALAVLTMGEARGAMVVCQHAGELLGLVGLEVAGAGRFDTADGDAVVTGTGELAPPLDLASLYEGVQRHAGRGRSR